MEGGNSGNVAQAHLLPWLLASIASAALVLLLAPRVLPLMMPTSQQDDDAGVDLFDIVREVRGDIAHLQSELIRRQEVAMFQIETVDVELSFVIKRSSSVGTEGGAPKLLVVSADSGYATEEVQKIYVHMSLADPGDPNIVIEGVPSDAADAIRLE